MPHPGGLVIGVVPARWGATRFPGKPLVDLRGKPMVVRVADAAKRALARVIIATDDERIYAAAKQHGHEVKMTPSDCATGTDRLAHALAGEDYALAVNVQGDEPLIDAADILALVEGTQKSGLPMGTLSRPLDPKRAQDPNVVKVITDHVGRAIYFSRANIAPGEARLHVGLYAYTREGLQTFTALEPGKLEQAERLEQLRALENGLPIHVANARSTLSSIAIDTPEDALRVLAVLDDPNDPRSIHGTR